MVLTSPLGTISIPLITTGGRGGDPGLQIKRFKAFLQTALEQVRPLPGHNIPQVAHFGLADAVVLLN